MSSPPLVLLHGAGGNAVSWAPTLPCWGPAAPRTPDLPGRGTRPGAPEPTARQAWLALAPSIPDGAVLVGHSYGGAVALEAALAAPERLSGVVLVSSGARLKVSPQILAAVDQATADAPFTLDFAFGPDTPAATTTAYQAMTRSTPPATTAADWHACHAFDVRDRLADISVPVLVVHGSLDRLTVPRFQAWLADQLPDCVRVELPGVGHMLPWEAPDALANTVMAWLAGR